MIYNLQAYHLCSFCAQTSSSQYQKYGRAYTKRSAFPPAPLGSLPGGLLPICVLNESESRRNFVFFQVTELPWNQDELAPETLPFVDKLAHINKHGILTINSQPNVNAAPSTDPVAGWGRPGGYVFQKVNMHDSFSY